MSALVAALIHNILQQGGESMNVPQVIVVERKQYLLRLIKKLKGRPTLTREQWEQLESKKQIKTSEQIRTSMRGY